ncbi:uncharacterized protein MONBRDRAFT_25264 [Monosiga brevicollis MX1]|uniref:Uncharacterized protein n=1 Tax=Monosiga brevicollis TaxID=81824 RepID=A9UYW4_MONBE|nr:uncharacterized protein MONBRDRAFT_25264 [Monosiga brevicollis MX1]EDQ89532.1 predicted protein [Monosiga brevicollis MX1]|eukprot:XP_001745561.1 hypothetical protein [Monosiga brevicollis MX1]
MGDGGEALACVAVAQLLDRGLVSLGTASGAWALAQQDPAFATRLAVVLAIQYLQPYDVTCRDLLLPEAVSRVIKRPSSLDRSNPDEGPSPPAQAGALATNPALENDSDMPARLQILQSLYVLLCLARIQHSAPLVKHVFLYWTQLRMGAIDMLYELEAHVLKRFSVEYSAQQALRDLGVATQQPMDAIKHDLLLLQVHLAAAKGRLAPLELRRTLLQLLTVPARHPGSIVHEDVVISMLTTGHTLFAQATACHHPSTMTGALRTLRELSHHCTTSWASLCFDHAWRTFHRHVYAPGLPAALSRFHARYLVVLDRAYAPSGLLTEDWTAVLTKTLRLGRQPKIIRMRACIMTILRAYLGDSSQARLLCRALHRAPGPRLEAAINRLTALWKQIAALEEEVALKRVRQVLTAILSDLLPEPELPERDLPDLSPLALLPELTVLTIDSSRAEDYIFQSRSPSVDTLAHGELVAGLEQFMVQGSPPVELPTTRELHVVAVGGDALVLTCLQACTLVEDNMRSHAGHAPTRFLLHVLPAGVDLIQAQLQSNGPESTQSRVAERAKSSAMVIEATPKRRSRRKSWQGEDWQTGMQVDLARPGAFSPADTPRRERSLTVSRDGLPNSLRLTTSAGAGLSAGATPISVVDAPADVAAHPLPAPTPLRAVAKTPASPGHKVTGVAAFATFPDGAKTDQAPARIATGDDDSDDDADNSALGLVARPQENVAQQAQDSAYAATSAPLRRANTRDRSAQFPDISEETDDADLDAEFALLRSAPVPSPPPATPKVQTAVNGPRPRIRNSARFSVTSMSSITPLWWAETGGWNSGAYRPPPSTSTTPERAPSPEAEASAASPTHLPAETLAPSPRAPAMERGLAVQMDKCSKLDVLRAFGCANPAFRRHAIRAPSYIFALLNVLARHSSPHSSAPSDRVSRPSLSPLAQALLKQVEHAAPGSTLDAVANLASGTLLGPAALSSHLDANRSPPASKTPKERGHQPSSAGRRPGLADPSGSATASSGVDGMHELLLHALEIACFAFPYLRMRLPVFQLEVVLRPDVSVSAAEPSGRVGRLTTRQTAQHVNAVEPLALHNERRVHTLLFTSGVQIQQTEHPLQLYFAQRDALGVARVRYTQQHCFYEHLQIHRELEASPAIFHSGEAPVSQLFLSMRLREHKAQRRVQVYSCHVEADPRHPFNVQVDHLTLTNVVQMRITPGVSCIT